MAYFKLIVLHETQQHNLLAVVSEDDDGKLYFRVSDIMEMLQWDDDSVWGGHFPQSVDLTTMHLDGKGRMSVIRMDRLIDRLMVIKTPRAENLFNLLTCGLVRDLPRLDDVNRVLQVRDSFGIPFKTWLEEFTQHYGPPKPKEK